MNPTGAKESMTKFFKLYLTILCMLIFARPRKLMVQFLKLNLIIFM